jgi:sterol desaturase/sphingolipid hydroxylase (fatty acid hydroxylase superfamily)
MESLISYFTTIPSSHRSLILVGGITFFWLLEGILPLVQFRYHKWKHAGVNFFFTFTTILVNFTLAFILLKTSDWAVANEFGLLQWLPEMSPWLYGLIGLLALDLIGAYTVHWSEHKVKWMWKFHLIHHTDTYVDTTSANRHHPGESVFRFIFTTIGVLLIGTPMWIVFLYQSLSVVLSQFNHANISLPRWLDKGMSWVIVSPNMHKVHHHFQLPYTDSNYGNIFAIWDHVFGTYRDLSPDKIVFGVDTHMKQEENSRLANLLKIPFQPYRPPQTQGND